MPSSTSPGDARPGVPAQHTPRGIAVVGSIGAVVGVLMVGLVAIATAFWWPGIVASIAVVPASAAAAVDILHERLPDLLVASCAAIGVFVAVVPRGSTGFTLAAVGAACVGVPLLAIHLASPRAMGYGDVKLGAALGTSIGSVSADLSNLFLLAMVALAVSSALGLVAAIVLHRRRLAYGPALVAGAAAAIVTADYTGGFSTSWH